MRKQTKTENRISPESSGRLSRAGRFRKLQLSTLKRGKVKSLGFWEGLLLKLAGRADGRRGLPLREDGVWRSPRLCREAAAYQEFCIGLWSRLQLEAEDLRARIRQLTQTTLQTELALTEARSALSGAVEEASAGSGSRRKGEEQLTQAQVARRRAQESAPRLQPFKSRVHVLEQKLERERAELLALNSKLPELEQSTELICRRVYEHTQLRAAVYWDAALRHHPEQGSIPIRPTLEIHPEGLNPCRPDTVPLPKTGTPEQDILRIKEAS